MRRQSVAFFLGDVGFLSDPKFRKLARRLTDPDDFNSAVGAFWIALAAARRNGLPTIDVAVETDSRFIPDLIKVGLLTSDGFPEKAYIAWAPSRTPRPGELRRDASNASNASNGDEVVENVRTVVPSTQLLSTPLPEKDPRAGSDGREDIETFVFLTRRAPTPRQRQLLDAMLDRHDLTGPSWAADIMMRHPDDPIGAVIAADKAYRAERIAEAQAAERPKPQPRRSPGLPQAARELVAEWAKQRREAEVKA